MRAGGGIFPLSLAVIGNIVPPRDRGRWQGLIGAVFAASSIIGPAVGGCGPAAAKALARSAYRFAGRLWPACPDRSTDTLYA